MRGRRTFVEYGASWLVGPVSITAGPDGNVAGDGDAGGLLHQRDLPNEVLILIEGRDRLGAAFRTPDVTVGAAGQIFRVGRLEA